MTSRRSPNSRIREILDRGSIGRCTVIVSPDRVRRERACDHLLDTVTKDPSPPLVRVRCQDLSQRELRSITSDMRSLSLFHPKRYFILNGAEALKSADLKEMAQAVSQLPDGYHAIALATQLPASNPLRAAAEKEDFYIELEALSGPELARWVEREVTGKGLKVGAPDLIDALVTAGDSSPDTIARLVELLSLYLDENEALTPKVLKNLFPAHSDPSDYELIDLLVAGDFARAERLLGVLLRNGRNPFLLLSLLVRSWLQLLEVKSLVEKGLSDVEIRTRLKLPPWIASKVLQQSRKVTKARAAAGLTALLWADSRLKGRSAGAETTMSEVAWRLAQ